VPTLTTSTSPTFLTIPTNSLPVTTEFNFKSPCLISWHSWIGEAISAGQSTGTVTSQSLQTMAPSATKWTVYLDLRNEFRICDKNLVAAEVSSVRVVPYTSTKTINFRAEPSLPSLLTPPPICSLPQIECNSVWHTLSTSAGEPGRIWEVAAELGPHLKNIGVELFGCPRPPDIDRCGQLDPGYELEDFNKYVSLQPQPFCTTSTPNSTTSVVKSAYNADSLRGKISCLFV
jgi:hypothetical protein